MWRTILDSRGGRRNRDLPRAPKPFSHREHAQPYPLGTRARRDTQARATVRVECSSVNGLSEPAAEPAAGAFCPPQARKFLGFLTHFTHFSAVSIAQSIHQRAFSTRFSPLHSEKTGLISVSSAAAAHTGTVCITAHFTWLCCSRVFAMCSAMLWPVHDAQVARCDGAAAVAWRLQSRLGGGRHGRARQRRWAAYMGG